MQISKGQWFACRYNGERNGDLILGWVKSVRRTGEVILVNSLTGSLSTKKIENLLSRCKRVSKEEADKIVALATTLREGGASDSHAYSELRKFAVSAPEFTNKKQLQLFPENLLSNSPKKNPMSLDEVKQALSDKLKSPPVASPEEGKTLVEVFSTAESSHLQKRKQELEAELKAINMALGVK